MMSKSMKMIPVLVIFLVGAIATASVALAADPDPDDVTVTGWGGAPGCTWSDGEVYVSNDSSEWDYKVDIDVRFENMSPGNTQCGVDPPDCTGQECECELELTGEVVEALDDREFVSACVLPSCQVGNCSHCDNTNDCDPDADHCTCAYGTYEVTHYRDTTSGSWIAMPPSYPIAITDKEQAAVCPALGPSCS
jgi:hypothetical protein